VVHRLAHSCLSQGDIARAIRVYRHLLHKQATAQRHDTLSRLTVLYLLLLQDEENTDDQYRQALQYSKEALELHQQNARPLQAAVSTMEVGLVHFWNQNLEQALRYWRQAMQMACVAMGYDHPHVAVLLNNIGVLHSLQDNTVASVRALQESVELQRTTLKNGVVNVEHAIHQLVTTMCNLAVVQGRGTNGRQTEQAVAILQEAMALYGSLSTTATIQNGLEDAIYNLMDQLTSSREEEEDEQRVSVIGSDASSSIMRQVAMFGNSDGIPNSLSLEAVDNNDFLLLGSLVHEATSEERVRETVLAWFGRQDDDEDDVRAFEKSLPEVMSKSRSIPVDLDGGKVVDAELHLDTIHAQVVEHLDRNEIDDALDIFHCALQSHREKYGEMHHLVGSTLHNMGTLYMYANQYDEAQKAFQDAARIQATALGPAHPTVASSMMKLGLLELARGDLSSASETFFQIRSRFLDVLGFGHPQMAKIVNNIAVVAYSQGDAAGAIRSFELAHEYYRRMKEDENDENEVTAMAMAHTMCNLGFVYAKEQQHVKSMELYEAALAIYSKHIEDKDNDPRVKTLLDNIQYLIASGTTKGWVSNGCQNPIMWFFDLM
jgi:tetratricopeptide (TPR) repeat protein